MIERTPTTPGSQATQCASGSVHDEFYLSCVGFEQVKSCQKPLLFLSFSRSWLMKRSSGWEQLSLVKQKKGSPGGFGGTKGKYRREQWNISPGLGTREHKLVKM